MTAKVPRRPSWAAVAVISSLCCLASSRPAAASAWNRQAGQGLVIIDYTLDGGTDYFNGSGHLAPARSYSKSELSAYVEYGATDALTLIACDRQEPMAVGGIYRDKLGLSEMPRESARFRRLCRYRPSADRQDPVAGA